MLCLPHASRLNNGYLLFEFGDPSLVRLIGAQIYLKMGRALIRPVRRLAILEDADDAGSGYLGDLG